MATTLGACRVLIFLNICSCWGQVQFPTYSYILPAIADKGGPVYVIPGTVTEKSAISLTNVTGSVCLTAGYWTNAAGIVTAAAGNTTAPGSDSFCIEIQPDGTEQKFEYGAVLISIEGSFHSFRAILQIALDVVKEKRASTALSLVGVAVG